MKITNIQTYPIYHGHRNYTFIKIDTDKEIYGIGEFGLTWKEQAGIGAIEHMKNHLIGLDPLNIEWIWQLLFRGDFFPGGRINTAAMSAIDIALWDIKGKVKGKSIHSLLGEEQKRVRAYVAGGYYAKNKGLKELQEELLHNVENLNATAIKIKIGDPNVGISEDMKRIEAARILGLGRNTITRKIKELDL